MKLYTKKLKIILECKYIYYILLFLILIYTIIYLNYYTPKEYYLETDTEFILTLKEYKIKNDKISFVFKENLVGTYYLKENETFNLKLNDKVIVTGELKIPNNNTIPNTFNYKKYLYHKGITHTLSIKEIKLYKENENILYKIKNKIYERINKIEHNEYLYAFILGKTNYIDEGIYNTYKTNGITHLFSLSSLHVSVFSSILFLILNKLKINKKLSFIFVTFFLLFFTFISSFTPSMLRSLVFFILVNVNKIYDLKIENINLLYLTLSILIIVNPNYIYNTGFILSFAITYFILLFSKYNRIKNKILNILVISIISFISSLPIIININYEINILCFINNVIFIPLVSYVVFPLSLLSFILPKISCVLQVSINVMQTISNISSDLIKINLIVSKFTIVEILIYYLTLILVIKSNKKIITYLVVILIYINVKPLIQNKNEVYFMDVKQGDSSIIISKNQDIIMIDTGGETVYKTNEPKNIISENIILFLKSKFINKIDYLILTHGDYDHMGEAVNLVNNFKVEKVIFNCGEFNDLENELIKVLDKKKIPYYSCIKELNIDDNKLYFLNDKDYGNENDNSSVIYTELNKHKFLFMGDAGIEVEEDLIEKYNLQDIDVLKVGHHGSKTSSSEEFIGGINPKYSVISVGKNNRYGHPNKEVLYNLENSKIYRTDQDGSVMFKIKNNKLEIETCPS